MKRLGVKFWWFILAVWYGEKPFVIYIPAGIFGIVRHEMWRERRIRHLKATPAPTNE